MNGDASTAGRPAPLRIAAVLAAALLLGASVYFFVVSQLAARRLRMVFDARPVWVAVDFSRPGKYQTVFENTYTNAPLHQLFLQVPGHVLADDQSRHILQPLVADVIIRGPAGDEVFSTRVSDIVLSEAALTEQIALTNVTTISKGRHVLEVTVIEGAAALEGVEQHLGSRYMFCGLEMISVALPLVVAIGTFIPAVIISLVLLIRHIQRRRRQSCSETSSMPVHHPQ